MNHSALEQEITAFFDAFVAAFSHFDGPLIAQRYAAPYVALSSDGSLQSYADAADIGRHFQRVVDGYHAQGCRSCRYRDLAVVALGSQSLLASVSWDMLRADAGVASSWRESYHLMRTPAGLRIFASVDHVE